MDAFEHRLCMGICLGLAVLDGVEFIRMPFLGEFTVRSLDFCLGCIGSDAKDGPGRFCGLLDDFDGLIPSHRLFEGLAPLSGASEAL